MNWKQIAFTSVITLFVTIVSGIIVNWYTKNQIENDQQEEKLVYSIRNISSFKTDSLQIAILNVEVSNVGNNKASNVLISIDFGDYSEILDFETYIERTKEIIVPSSQSSESILFKNIDLFPNDRIVINIALNEITNDPSISIQSSKTIGIPFASLIQKETEKDPLEEGLLVVILTGFLLIPSLFIFTRLFRKLKGYSRNLNNSAFLFLHNKETKIAEEMLLKSIMDNGADSHELSNLALAKCLNNKSDYKAFLRMSKFLSNSNRDNLVLNFNSFLVFCIEKDYLNAKESLLKARKLDNKELSKYINHSLILDELRSQDSKVEEIVSNE